MRRLPVARLQESGVDVRVPKVKYLVYCPTVLRSYCATGCHAQGPGVSLYPYQVELEPLETLRDPSKRDPFSQWPATWKHSCLSTTHSRDTDKEKEKVLPLTQLRPHTIHTTHHTPHTTHTTYHTPHTTLCS